MILVLLVAAIVASESVTRGYVTGGDGRPLVGADVWLADSTGVVHQLRTDNAGYYRVVHAPFERQRYTMLICEGRRRMFVSVAPMSAIVRTEYGIGAYTGRFPEVPADRGWTADVPPSCPVKFVPPAG
ncbi:carboxypeptidase-like regulatory domain-containing protein [Gemmatimonas sp.]|uniref:carboxypeptidase-like regulatory domain-containing protein n=1 Tax=Gemmatimonas sp. TaxID=1962908 RepID=UPI003F717934